MQRSANFLTIIILLLSLEAMAQKPTILSVDKENGGMREVVTLRGSDFGITKADLRVFFGGAAAEIKEVSNQIMEVRTPPGATFDNISVTNITNGLTGYSPRQFYLQFNGDQPLSTASFSPQTNFQSLPGLYDLCLCDFNLDGKLDVATANTGSPSISIFQNGSTVGTINLTALSPGPLLNAKSLHATCGDLNGDGRPDIAVTEDNSDRLFLLRNTGAFTFSITNLTLTGKKLKRVAIADLDLDGKPDVVLTDQADNSVTVLPNQSANASNIVFAAAQNIDIDEPVGTDGLEIEDMNGNGLPEIIVSAYNSPSDIFICENKSSPGNFNFTDVTRLDVNKNIMSVKTGDLDGNGKPDIIATCLVENTVAIFRNQSTGTQLSFSSEVDFETNPLPWGLDLGDLDGNGQLDIIVSSISGTTRSISVLSNTSTGGNLSFAPLLKLASTYINRQPKVGDLDGDGKPDIAFVSADRTGEPSSMISVLRNHSCFIPVVSPGGPLTICTGFPLELTSTIGGGVTYEWQQGGTPVGTNSPFLDITTSGAYTIVAKSEGATCSRTSNTVNITVSGSGLGAGPPDARSNTPVCTENTLILEVDDLGATDFNWKGPSGYTGSGRTPSIPDFSLSNAGIYVVELINNGCVAKVDTTIVEGIDNPDFTVTYSGSQLVCQGTAKTLSVSPVMTSGFTYQWYEKTLGLLSGKTANTLQATATGEYYASVKSAFIGCAAVQTPDVDIKAVSVPDAAFTASANTACIGQEITFTNTSVSDPSETPLYTWAANGNTFSTETSFVRTFTQAGPTQVKLRVTYANGACPNEEMLPLTILNTPAISIVNPDNLTQVCPESTLRLEVSGSNITSYTWSTGATTEFIMAGPGDYGVTVTNNLGCILKTTKQIEAFVVDPTSAQAEKTQLRIGETSNLSAKGGIQNFLWRPSLNLSDSTIANPIASPLQNVTYTVSGTDINGCKGEASVSLIVLGSAALDLIKPKIFFSPNDDGINNYWTVQDIESFPQCGVAVYNDKGSKVFEAKPYLNDWDGTFKGSKLPGGVYYYVIRCDEEKNVKTGSITLLK